MSSVEWKAQVLPSLIAGVSRRPIPAQALGAGGDSGLRALSLVGQALRFDAPAGPASYAVEARVEDTRKILPEPARRRLLRLLAGKRSTADVELALAWAFARLRLRPHPFDLPRMESFVRSHAECLGVAAEHWLARQQEGPAPAAASYYAEGELDATTWAAATLGRRVRYFEERRREDPAQALTLLEAAWPQQDADARVRLTAALAIGLSAADSDFLIGLKADRAPRVRAAAERLLSRLPGASGDHPALKAVLERIRKTQTGLLRKHPVIKLELPATVKENVAAHWIREAFADVTWAELARGLELGEREMIDAAKDDRRLLLALAVVAIQDLRLDLLESLLSRNLRDGWELLTASGPADLSAWTPGQRGRWCELLAEPYGAELPKSFAAWRWMFTALEQPMPERVLLPVVDRPNWLDDVLAEGKWESELLTILAACCPRTLRGRLRLRFESIDPALRVDAEQMMDVLDAMETA